MERMELHAFAQCDAGTGRVTAHQQQSTAHLLVNKRFASLLRLCDLEQPGSLLTRYCEVVMKIGIVGAGNVGGTLGRRWAKKGHSVLFGVRNPDAEKVRALLDTAGENCCAERLEDLSPRVDVILLATPYDALRAVISALGPMRNTILIDATNPLAPGFRLAVGHSTSGAEQLSNWLPDVPVVKAFNTVGFENMADPRYNDERATMFICGDDRKANEIVAALAGDLDFDPVITGPLKHARYLEPLAMLWIDMAMRQGRGRAIAFKLLSRDE
jgi:8-hydroxy-5-deazaflavin:NADPH oxidoreductase